MVIGQIIDWLDFYIDQNLIVFWYHYQNSSISSSFAKNLFDYICKYCFLLSINNLQFKIDFVLNHCKCTDHTSNKVDLKSRYHSHEDRLKI